MQYFLCKGSKHGHQRTPSFSVIISGGIWLQLIISTVFLAKIDSYSDGEKIFCCGTRRFITIITKVKKAKVHPCTGTEALYRPLWPTGGIEVQLYSFITMALEGCEGSASRPDHSLPPRERPGTRCAGGAGWAPGPVWTGAENLTPTGI